MAGSRKEGTRKPSGVYVFHVEDADLSPFRPTVESIVRMAFTAGLEPVAARGETMEVIKTDRAARSRFLRGCHRGYDKAQARVGSEVVGLQEKIFNVEDELTRLRQAKDPGHIRIHNRIIVLRNRQLALRRIIDALLLLITNSDTWILRRLLLEDRIHDIDPKVLGRTLEVASRRNADSRLRFSLVGDLSTVVQIGDLVEISFESDERRWKVIELAGRYEEP